MSKVFIKPLDTQQLWHALEQRPGLIPVDIDLSAQRLIWLDMGKYHIYEGKFRNAVDTCSALNQRFSRSKTADYFSSTMDILDSDSLPFERLYPSGFIFHMSRCGSTLLTKALAQSRTNLVFGEALPHSKFWRFLNKDRPDTIKNTPQNQRRYRNLLLAMGRKRINTHQHYFIKFTSYYVLFIDIIMAAFPDVPATFIYRNPEEVLVSLEKKGTEKMSRQDDNWTTFIAGSTHYSNSVQYFSHALKNGMAAALNKKSDLLSYLNYEHLNSDALPSILSQFNVAYNAEEVERMKAQFSHYSKSDYGRVTFVSDSNKKQKAITPEIALLSRQFLKKPYQCLLTSNKNII